MPFCTNCGHENPASARFCSQCGTRLASTDRGSDSTSTVNQPAVDLGDGDSDRLLSTEEQAAIEALPPGSALLVVLRGPGAGSRFLLDTDQVSVGRHPYSEIFLDDVTVSRQHAVFRRTSDGYLVADVGSLNGTYVNRDRVDEILLTNGDEVQIGKFRLVYFSAAGGART
jgi:pSer/pThr/pTyr-binding forkhead associated (FHA) protein